MSRIRLLNGSFDPLTLGQTVDCAFARLAGGRRGWLATVNVAILMGMRSDPQLQKFVDEAGITVADGQPLIWLSRMLRRDLPERVAGVDLVNALCQRAAVEGKRVYLLGSTQANVSKLASRLRVSYPALQLAWADGYFSDSEAVQRASRIREDRTDILLIGMGVPRQERFLQRHWDTLGVSLAVPVGGSFDVLCGLRARAPKWMQRIGMEWFFRLVQEPRRLLVRYTVTNIQFLWLAAGALASKRSRKAPPESY
jgi:N-acetylglucosaminyldiphosphoundecaprenol N-acetyl-beta-D-mannosaminyltransferase